MNKDTFGISAAGRRLRGTAFSEEVYEAYFWHAAGAGGAAGAEPAGRVRRASGAGAATAETAAPAPTAAPQQLTVHYAGGADSPAATALRAYAAAQGVTLQELYPGEDPAAADLAVLEAEPADDGSWKDLTADALLATAAARAGLDAETPVYALPFGKTLYAYWADSSLLAALLGADADTLTGDLQAAAWGEWSDLAEALTAWLEEPAETDLTLNGNTYTLPAERPEAAAGLEGVFSLSADDAVAGGDGLPLYTAACWPPATPAAKTP